MPHIVHSVTLSTGVTLPYAEQGDPSGTPVLMLHGYSDSWRSFERMLEHLPGSIHAFVPSQRGHGDADRPPTGYRPEDFAADAEAFLDAVDAEAAVITGHSAGSVAAQHLAAGHPQRVLGLLLIGSRRTFRGNPGLMELQEVVSGLTDPVDPAFVREFQVSTLARPIPEDYLETVIAESLKVPARVWREALTGLLESDAPSESATITAPTRLVWGERDGLCSLDDQRALNESIPGSRLTVYPGTGHAVHWEQPDRVAADLQDLIEHL